MQSLKHAAIEVHTSSIHGYGVFAKQFIPKNTIIEECAALVILDEDCAPDLEHYAFIWDEEGKYCALALGYGSLYNHGANERNAAWYKDFKRKVITIVATKNIYRGDEILVNYGNKYFATRGITARNPQRRKFFGILHLEKVLLAVLAISAIILILKGVL